VADSFGKPKRAIKKTGSTREQPPVGCVHRLLVFAARFNRIQSNQIKPNQTKSNPVKLKTKNGKMRMSFKARKECDWRKKVW
jgi:hypothetical protein